MDRKVSLTAEDSSLFREVRDGARPSDAIKDRIRRNIQKRTSVAHLLETARESVLPEKSMQQTLWAQITRAIRPTASVSLWERLRATFTPSSDTESRLWQRISPRLQPAYTRVLVSRPIKLIAAFSILLFLVRVSPLVLLAPASIADASVQLLPTRGQVSVLTGGLWQPVTVDTAIRQQTLVQTQDGEATIVLFDDAVIRMAPHTIVALNDFSDRPKAPQTVPSVSLREGRMWVLGLIPSHIDGLTIGTPQGSAIVHEGSISLQQMKNDTLIQVWHRSATVLRRSRQMFLVAGEEVRLKPSDAPLIARADDNGYSDPWVSVNLSRDAVHQREIAQLQQERRAASAGILPSSGLYPAKRLAEAVDLFFTFGEEARAKKTIDHANTRLNEAAALIGKGGEDEAKEPLREYRESMLALANASGSAVSSLVQKEVVDATADVAASLPDDPSYVLKQAVRQTIEELPASLEKPDTETATLLDELTAVNRYAHEGEVQTAKVELEKVKSSLPTLTGSSSLLTADMRKEVEATLSSVTAAIAPEEQIEPEAESEDINRPIRAPTEPVLPAVPMTDDQIASMVLQMRNRIVGAYESLKGRQNQMQLEFKRIEALPDRGRILRQLYHILPEEGLGTYVRIEIQKVAEEQREKGK